ncbi:hypothetical protein [Vandammella animalimorsus]|uniref:hypothetical protein n=1 Tax=Vandammella animalimorsus TaxID=2029117 RepID=UPI001177F0F5|nr:hypothetical protein [Vandammella animalimorsus]
MNVEKIIGPGPLKIKYKIISSMDFLCGNICFMHDGVEIGDYDDVVNLNDVHDWLNDFSQKGSKRFIGFLDGESKESLLNFIYFQIMTFITPDGRCESCESPPLLDLYRMGKIFHLDDHLSYSFLDKFFGILFNDLSMKKQRFIWGAWRDRVPHEILLDFGYFEELICDFSSSFVESLPYRAYKESESIKKESIKKTKIEREIGLGDLKIKYKIASRDGAVGGFCIKFREIEIGDYGKRVSLLELGSKLNEFSKNRDKRVMGFLDGSSSSKLFEFVYGSVSKNEQKGDAAETLSALLYKMKKLFHLNECFPSSYSEKYPAILFDDGLVKKQRLICLSPIDGLLYDFLLEPGYFEGLVEEFSRSLRESLGN